MLQFLEKYEYIAAWVTALLVFGIFIELLRLF